MRALVISLISIVLVGCSNHLPPAGIEAYNRCQYEKAIEIFSKAEAKKKDALLYDLAILSSAVHEGDNEEVKKAGLRAQQLMWSYEGNAQGAASLISSEAIRIYKGEPFEKTMASLYLGIVYFNEGDFENARAAFTKAMFAVQTKNEKLPADFAAPYVLLAKTYINLKDDENAGIVLSKLKKNVPAYSLNLDILRKSHTIIFVEIGRGPQKVRTGPGGSLVDWQRRVNSIREVHLTIDGKPLEIEARTKDDLTYQAKTVDRGGKTAIQATKGALRDVSAVTAVVAADVAVRENNETAGWVALGAGMFALANQSQADVRQWELLPDQLQLVLSSDPKTPGKHEYMASFVGRFQNDLSNARQVWYDERKSDQDKIYIAIAKPCGH